MLAVAKEFFFFPFSFHDSCKNGLLWPLFHHKIPFLLLLLLLLFFFFSNLLLLLPLPLEIIYLLLLCCFNIVSHHHITHAYQKSRFRLLLLLLRRRRRRRLLITTAILLLLVSLGLSLLLLASRLGPLLCSLLKLLTHRTQPGRQLDLLVARVAGELLVRVCVRV